MEKQIMIKHKNNEISFKIKNIVDCLRLLLISNEKIVCGFRLYPKDFNALREIKYLEECDKVIKIESIEDGRGYLDYNVIVYLQNIESFLTVIEKYELNIMIYCNNVKIFLNDNDGDFIIINSNHKDYNAIKKLKK